MKKFLENNPDISLILIGIALENEYHPELNELCRLTKDGFFI